MADLIDRDLTIYELEAFRESCIANLMRMSFDDITDVVKDIPAVNRWIPVEDALPENKCGVIFTVDRGHPFVCVGYRINSERDGLKLQRWFDKLSGLNFSDYDVKAWMPMPDAYEPPESKVQE